MSMANQSLRTREENAVASSMNDVGKRLKQLSAEEKRDLLARLLRERVKAVDAAPPSNAVDAFPLSYAQERLWFLDQLQPGGSNYNIPVALRFQSPLHVRALEWSLNEIVRRHEILRTTFATQDGGPVQVVAPELALRLAVHDLQDYPAEGREAEAHRLAMEEARGGFELGRGPLIRVKLLRLGAQDHILLLTMHHIISDGWSFGILLKELKALYEAACRGNPSPLAPLPIQYADYAVWQRKWLTETRLKEEIEYWRGRLAGVPEVLALPTDRPRPAVQSSAGAAHAFRCPPDVSEGLVRIARAAGGTLFMVLLAAFKVLLYRYTGQSDLVVGTPMANRTRTELEGLIGFFINMLVLRTDLSGNPSFRDVLRRVKEVTLSAYDHAEVPFERIVEELQPDRSVSSNPIFQVAFALQNAPTFPAGAANKEEPSQGRAERADEPPSAGIGTSKFDLVLAMGETPDGLAGAFEYSTDLFDPATIRQMQHHFTTILEVIAQDQETPVLDIPLPTNSRSGSRPSARASQADDAECFQF
jgi:hypothetical protein